MGNAAATVSIELFVFSGPRLGQMNVYWGLRCVYAAFKMSCNSGEPGKWVYSRRGAWTTACKVWICVFVEVVFHIGSWFCYVSQLFLLFNVLVMSPLVLVMLCSYSVSLCSCYVMLCSCYGSKAPSVLVLFFIVVRRFHSGDVSAFHEGVKLVFV